MSDRKLDFHYSGITVDYYTRHECDEHGCADEGICRCGEIEDAEITSIDLSRMAYPFIGLFKDIEKTIDWDDEFINYAIGRICVKHGLYDKSKFNINICGGYYGQEIDSVVLWEKADEDALIADVSRFLLSKNKMEFLFELEYGKVLPHLEGKTWTIEEVDYNDVIAPAKKHLREVEETESHFYGKDYEGIVAVCVPAGKNYKIVDGYHRYNAKKGNKNGKLKVLIGRDTVK
jgi:hypothetical protein